ncbi:MAG: amidohydrolase family protein [Acidobacteriota bacterium]
MSKLPRVNCHVHVFNLEVATTEWAKDVIEKRIQHDYGETAAKVLGGFARDLVDGLGDLNEERLLRELLDRLDLTDRISDNLQTIGLRALRRLVDRQLEKLREDPEMDFRETDAHDLLETLRIGGKADVDGVMDWLMSQVADDAAVVPLMMDLTDGVSDVTDVAAGESQFERQLEATSRQVKRYPGRVLPFVFVHPKRPNHLELMRRAVDELGYVGVKLYPSLGYELTGPAMDQVYTFCQANDVPIMIHTNKGGFVGAVGANRFPDPDVWREQILPRFPNLKVCMAHFGGSGSLTEGNDPLRLPPDPPNPDGSPAEPRWGQKIIDLIRDRQFPNIYADVAFHRSGMDADDRQERYFNRIKGMLGHADMQSRILFGTDFWLIRPRLRESSHWRYFESNLTDAEFEQLAETNPAEFLGLPGGGGANGTIQSYVRFLGAELQKEAVAEEMASPPAPWLLDAIEADATLGAAVRRQIEALAAEHSVPARLFGGISSWRDLLDAVRAIPLDRDFDRDFAISTGPLDTSVLGGTVSFDAAAELQVKTFHDADQTDIDAILRPPPADQPMSDFERRRLGRPVGNLIPFMEDRAWLKARFDAKVQGDLSTSSGLAALEVDGEKSVVLTDYRAHDRNTSLFDAVRETFRRPRFALDRDDVLRLGDGDAVSLATRGRIGGELTLSWADVFTSGLDQLTEALGSTIPIRLSVDVGASVSAGLEVQDDFRVVFARREQRTRVSVSKIKSTGKSAKIELTGGVQFSDPDQLADVLDQLVAQRLGQAQDRIERFLGLEAVESDAERNTLGQLEAALNEQGLDAVQGAIKSLRDTVETTIETIVKTRLSLGFSYHYEHLETEAVVFDADLSDRIVEQLHHEIVDGDLTGVLDRFHRGATEEINLHQFLRLRETERSASWGFHLGSLGDRRKRKTVFAESVDIRGAKKLAFFGLDTYTSKTGWPDVRRGKFATAKWSWQVDLNAEMSAFRPAPKASDFTFSLGFQTHWEDRFSKKRLGEWLDQARLWRAVDPAIELDAIVAAFEPLDHQNVRAEVEILFDHEILRHLLHGPLAKAPTDDARRALEAGALAAALPYRDESARRTPAKRREHFTTLWKAYLTEEANLSFANLRGLERAERWAGFAAQLLDQAGLGDAASTERNFRPNRQNLNVFPWTIGGRLFLDGGPHDALASARRGLAMLRDVLPNPHENDKIADPNLEAEAVEEIFDELTEFWSEQTHYLRAAGALLADAAQETGLLDKVRSSFTIRCVDLETDRVDIGGVPGRDEG